MSEDVAAWCASVCLGDGEFVTLPVDMLRGLAAGELVPTPKAWVWKPMAEAPRDGTVILVEMRPDLVEATGRADLARWAGCYVAVRWSGDELEAWGVATPVGVGGLPDAWMTGWHAIYPTRREPVANFGLPYATISGAGAPDIPC